MDRNRRPEHQKSGDFRDRKLSPNTTVQDNILNIFTVGRSQLISVVNSYPTSNPSNAVSSHIMSHKYLNDLSAVIG
jgi:hypothetical protein